MKTTALAIILVVFLSGSAYPQFAAQLSTARTVSSGVSKGGVYAGIYDHAFGILGQYRYGVGGYTDIGIKAGLLDIDSRGDDITGFDASFDLKYQVMELRMRDPLELSIGGTFEFLVADELNILSLGFATIGSYPINLNSGRVLEPYGRLHLRVQREDTDFGDDTSLEIGFNMGTAFELSRQITALGEIQFDDEFAFLFGVDFGL
jgi:hypothetical protein